MYEAGTGTAPPGTSSGFEQAAGDPEGGSTRSAPEGGWPRLARSLLYVACAVALLLSIAAQARFIWGVPIDMDELEFVRATRWVAEGKTPYLDFWEHHFPLQWYLMAPLARWMHVASIETFRVMRLGNSVFVAGSGLLVFLIASLGGRRRLPGVVAVLLLISAEVFVGFTTTYRIDGPMSFFYLLGIYLLERALEAGPRVRFYTLSAGAALAFAGLCSQRALPGVAVATVLYLLVRPGERWGFHPKAAWTAVSGTGIALVVAASWAAAGGLGTFWNQNVVTNRLYEKLPAGYQLPSLSYWMEGSFQKSASLRVLGFLAVVSVGLAILKFRKPTFGLRVAVLTVTQIVFLATISSPFGYQLQLFMWLLALMAMVSLEALLRLRKWPDWIVLLVVAGLFVGSSGKVTWRAQVLPSWRAIQEHQDHVLRRLDEVARPGERVLDGCGWGLNRESAFGFWFLPRLVRVLTAHRAIIPLTEEAVRENPPAAIVMDSRTVLYLKQVGLQDFVSANYLPLERAIWVPGMSGRMALGEEKSWDVLVGGRYRLVEDARQAGHPWFSRPFDFARNTAGPADRFVIDFRKEPTATGPRMAKWTIDGMAASPGEAGEFVNLAKGSRLSARNGGPGRLAVFAVPERWSELMTMPCFPSWFELTEEW